MEVLLYSEPQNICFFSGLEYRWQFGAQRFKVPCPKASS